MLDEFNVVVIPDEIRTPKVVKEVSLLRHERWAILACFDAQNTKTGVMSENDRVGLRNRLRTIHNRLYKLTKLEIYNDQ
tara:strand:- start:43 stop:279 length:237 start_codon:yes stop_codon:yes gene_type:complete